MAVGGYFFYDGERAHFLDLPGQLSGSARAINDAGDIAGGLFGDDGIRRSYLLHDGVVNVLPDPVVFASGSNHEALALNNAGSVIVDWYDSATNTSGTALYIGSTYFNLGNGSYAQDINNRDWAVGYATQGIQTWATVAHDGRQYRLDDLMMPGSNARWAELEYARAINDRGQILGEGLLADGSRHAFIATPVPEGPAVPSLLAGLGVLGAVLRARRRVGSSMAAPS